MNKTIMAWIKYTIITLVMVGMVAGIVICFYVSATRTLTPTESVLVSFILTFLGIFASWLFTHVYADLSTKSATEEAKKAHNDNIRTFARKAAEKLLNLSNELSRLAASMRNGLEELDEDETSKFTILTLKERLGGAIHIIETLKSMNDTSLSDWKGVIGEEIQRQEQVQIQIDAIHQRLEEQKVIKEELEETMVGSEELETVQNHIQEIKDELEQKIAALPFRSLPFNVRTFLQKSKKKQHLPVECPACNETRNVFINPRPGANKSYRCKGCKKYLKATCASETDMSVEVLSDFKATAQCPVCTHSFEAEVPDMLGISREYACPDCDTKLSIARSKDGLACAPSPTGEISDKLLAKIHSLIPPHPWPQGMHKQVAEKLHLSNKMVTKAVGRLILQGKIQAPPAPSPTVTAPAVGAKVNGNGAAHQPDAT